MACSVIARTLALAASLSAAASPFLAGGAAAQDYPQDGGYQTPPAGYGQAPSGYDQGAGADDQGPPPGYDQAPPPGYNQGPPPAGYGQYPQAQGYGQGYAQGAPQAYGGQAPQYGYAQGDDQPPPGYDGRQLPPPPAGYQPGPGMAVNPQLDQRYEAYAEDWARQYCVKAQNNTGAGAVIGGLLGALVGSGVAGRHDRGAGAIVGGVAGAAGGAAVGSADSHATSPGCPPGFVVRGDAPAFAFDGYESAPYVYAAPAWYRPWVFVGGRWDFRPYPYHVWYYRHYGYGRPGYRPYGRPGRWHGRPY